MLAGKHHYMHVLQQLWLYKCNQVHHIRVTILWTGLNYLFSICLDQSNGARLLIILLAAGTFLRRMVKQTRSSAQQN